MTREEKDKLIELSDLNREDNIKYISSEAQGIAITLDSDRYAPTFCKLERAYICGRRKSEEQIADIKANCDLAIEGRDIKIKELEKEIAELKADNDARKFAMAMSEKVEKQLREENEELKSEKGCETCTKFDEVKLTKAKELIEDMYDKIPASHSDYYKDVMERARQFIKEIE